MKVGRRLIWLAVGSSLVINAVGVVATLNDDDPDDGKEWFWLIAAAWLILSFWILQRRQWARWIAAVILAGLGLLFMALGLASVLQTFSNGGVEWGSFVSVGLGLIFLTDACILIFPDSVGDFFAARKAISDWTFTSKAARIGQNDQKRFKRDELLDSLPEREIMMVRGRQITLFALGIGWLIFLGGMGWILHRKAIADQENEKEVQRNYEQQVAAANQIPIVGGLLILVDRIAYLIVAGLTALAAVFDAAGILVLGYVALFVIPFLLALPFVLLFARKGNAPATFLILRPFNNNRITQELARFLREEMSPFGHCYTLSDRRVRVPAHVRVPLLLGQLSFFNFRARKIRHPQHIEKIVKGMKQRVLRNLNWCFSRTKLFPVSCSDEAWRPCISRLVDEVDIVVVELGSITGNILWEIELLRSSGALSRTVFVVEESQEPDVVEAIAQILGHSQPAAVLTYGRRVSSTCVARDSIIDILCGELLNQGVACPS